MADQEANFDEMRSRLEQERLRALVTNIALGVLVEDEQRMVALANDAFCQFFDIPVPPAQLVGTSCEAAAVQVAQMLREPATFEPRIQQLIAGRVSAVADEIVFRDGRVIERDYVPIAVDSVRRGHLWLFRDVTQSRELAQLERAAAVHDELRLAIDMIPGLVWSAEPAGQVELFNQRWREYTGLEFGDDGGWTWEAMIAPEDLPDFQAHFAAALASGTTLETEARLRQFDGQYRWFLFRVVPLLGKSGAPLRWYGQAIDIDDRKRSEEALQHAQSELSRVARVTTLGELAASIAHEINQPISAMVADASACLNRLGAERPDMAKIRESLTAIVADGARAGEVLTRIRALLARSELAHGPCSIEHVVKSSVALARAELLRHGFVVDLSLGAADETVLGDGVELQQVLLNLLLNASEAARELPAERRRIVIESRNLIERGEPCISLSVRDFGVGIDPVKRDRLFSAFYTTKPFGLGMGLSITRSIVDRHRGRVLAQSNADHGATFTVTLPLIERPASG